MEKAIKKLSGHYIICGFGRVGCNVAHELVHTRRPFVAIDLIISNILLAMGMMMVSPMTISLPFKLLLFVMLDGWTRLIQGLVLSYYQ